MPNRFFLDEPRGRKAMSRLGTQSIPMARVISVFLIVVMLASAAALGALVVAAKPKPVNPNIVQPGGVGPPRRFGRQRLTRVAGGV